MRFPCDNNLLSIFHIAIHTVYLYALFIYLSNKCLRNKHIRENTCSHLDKKKNQQQGVHRRIKKKSNRNIEYYNYISTNKNRYPFNRNVIQAK